MVRNIIHVDIECSSRNLILLLVSFVLIFGGSQNYSQAQQGIQQPVRTYQPVERIIPVEHLPVNNADSLAGMNPEKQELKRPKESTKSSVVSNNGSKPATPTSILPALLCCLSILMVFWLATLSFKKKSPQFAPAIPTEALEFLGRKSIDLRSSIYYLRCGSRILIVGHSEAGLQTLGEVTDPLEVDIISGMCRAEKSRESSISESFRTLFLRTQPQESSPMPTSSLKDRLHKSASQATSTPVMRDGRKIV